MALYDVRAWLVVRADDAEEARRIAEEFDGTALGDGTVGISLDDSPAELNDYDDEEDN